MKSKTNEELKSTEMTSRSFVMLIIFLIKSHSQAQIDMKCDKSQIAVTIHYATEDIKPLFFVCLIDQNMY